MKKILSFLILISSLFMFSSCELILYYLLWDQANNNTEDDAGSSQYGADDPDGNFYVSYGDSLPYTYKKVKLEEKATGTHCKVWYYDENKSLINLKTADFEKLASKFDSIYEKEISVFGSNVFTSSDSDIISFKNTDKLNIVVFDISNDASASQTGRCFGFFFNGDMVNHEVFKSGGYTFKSNRKEIIYIDSYLLTKFEDEIYSTLVHEFQHLLFYVNKGVKKNLAYETWNTEMMSMLAEEIFQKDLGISDKDSPKGRISYFDLGSFYGFTDVWDSNKILPGSFEYANAYSFGTYLMHNYNGVNFVKKLAQNDYVNFDSVTKAIIDCDKTQLLLDWATTYITASLPAVTGNSDFVLDEINFSDYFMSETKLDADYLNSSIKKYNSKYETNYEKLPYSSSDALIYSKGPNILSGSKQVQLYPTGFSVHYLGDSAKTYNFTQPTDNNIKMYLYQNGNYTVLKGASFTSASESELYLIKINTGSNIVSASSTGSCTNGTTVKVLFNTSDSLNSSRSLSESEISEPKTYFVSGRNPADSLFIVPEE